MKSNKIKICFICPKAYPIFDSNTKSTFGGTEVDLYNISTELAKDNNYEVKMLVADYAQEKSVTLENVKLIKTVNFKKNILSQTLNLIKALKKTDCDIFFMQGLNISLPLCVLIAKLRNKKFIFRTASSIHCNGIWLTKHKLHSIQIKWALRKINRVICQNAEDQKNCLNTYKIKTATVISNGQRFQEYNNNNKQGILWVGRSDTLKQPYLFIEIAKKMPNYNFTMICPKATNDNNYDTLIEKATKQNNLKFIKYVDFKNIDSYFIDNQFFVNTSSVEGFPNTFIQACKAATPIASLNINPDNFLNKENCGICTDGNLNNLCNNIETIIKDSNKFKTLSQNALNYAKNKHDIQIIIHEYKSLFKELTNEQ